VCPRQITASSAQSINTGGSRLAVAGGQIWYRVVGGGTGTPLIVIHGGPGLSSGYLKSMEALGDERLVVRYDQLGAGKSDVVTDTSLFGIERFVGELETLRRHLALERVHLYGHSWGSILALEYYRAHPEHVASLTLASEVLDMPAFFANMRRLISEMPDSMSRAVQLKEAGQPYDTSAFWAAGRRLRQSSSRKPVRAEGDSMMRTANDAVTDYLNGTSVFKPNGRLRDYDATALLRTMKVPVLFTVGEFDFVGPDLVKQHAALTPGARFAMVPGAAHMVQWDNAPANNDAVRVFLRDVDGTRPSSSTGVR
jgi:proline iminopeptidase